MILKEISGLIFVELFLENKNRSDLFFRKRSDLFFGKKGKAIGSYISTATDNLPRMEFLSDYKFYQEQEEEL